MNQAQQIAFNMHMARGEEHMKNASIDTNNARNHYWKAVEEFYSAKEVAQAAGNNKLMVYAYAKYKEAEQRKYYATKFHKRDCG